MCGEGSKKRGKKSLSLPPRGAAAAVGKITPGEEEERRKWLRRAYSKKPRCLLY